MIGHLILVSPSFHHAGVLGCSIAIRRASCSSNKASLLSLLSHDVDCRADRCRGLRSGSEVCISSVNVPRDARKPPLCLVCQLHPRPCKLDDLAGREPITNLYQIARVAIAKTHVLTRWANRSC